ncbi:F-box protein At2g39490-like [Durio zibethinus]|uniref:F-box protein At2g39490-like n=1 Tax=Durio zibethinus TaxID=66656 RepID=A0A6P6AHD1_DURZI|nr:F-box protein At2g39490-like [Durio zibethinus]
MGKQSMIKKKNREKEQDPADNLRNTANEQLNMEPKDLISCFPDEILFRIITFLPFESAVQTTLLSTRWKDLWKKTLVLKGTIEDVLVNIFSLLDDFAELHPPRNTWGFQFDFGQGRVLFVAIAPNNTLHLDFSSGEQEIPRSFDWLLPLNLPSSNQWPFPYNHDKSLTIAKCNGVQSLDIHNVARLQKLVSFRYQASCKCNPPWLSFMWNFGLHMEDVMLDFRQGPTQWTWQYENDFHYTPRYGIYKRNHCGCATKLKCFKSIGKSIDNVKSLTLCKWFFEESICKKLLSARRNLGFCFNKLKELWWIDCSMERENIDALLCFLKFCPNLERLYVTIDPKCYNLPSTEKFSAIVSVTDKLNDLKVVKLEGYGDEQKEILLARRLIPLFRGNPVILSKSNGTCLRHMVKLHKLEKKGMCTQEGKFSDPEPSAVQEPNPNSGNEADGTVERYKASLVAKSYTQTYGVDY